MKGSDHCEATRSRIPHCASKWAYERGMNDMCRANFWLENYGAVSRHASGVYEEIRMSVDRLPSSRYNERGLGVILYGPLDGPCNVYWSYFRWPQSAFVRHYAQNKDCGNYRHES